MTVQISKSAYIYADSLIQTDIERNVVSDNLNVISSIINSSVDLRKIMINPTAALDKKYEILEEVFKNQIDERIINFLKVLVSKNKFGEFEQIKEAYFKINDDINNIKRVDIISAVELSEEQKSKTLEKLKNKYQKEIIANWISDSDIIGGLIIKTEDDITDNSIRNKLNRLSKI